MGFNSFDFADDVVFSLQTTGNSNMPTAGDCLDIWAETNAALSQYYQTGKGNLPDSDPNNIYTSNTLGPNQDVHGLDWLLNDPTVDDYAKVEDFIKEVMVDGNKSQFSASTISTVLGLILNNWDPGPQGGSSPSPTYQAKVQEFGQMVSSVGTVETTPGQGEIKTEGNFMTTITSALQTVKELGTTIAGIFGALVPLLQQTMF